MKSCFAAAGAGALLRRARTRSFGVPSQFSAKGLAILGPLRRTISTRPSRPGIGRRVRPSLPMRGRASHDRGRHREDPTPQFDGFIRSTPTPKRRSKPRRTAVAHVAASPSSNPASAALSDPKASGCVYASLSLELKCPRIDQAFRVNLGDTGEE